jgi:cation transport regulator ChaC
MSVSRVQIEVELHSAERALEAARERRETAERVLWSSVSRSSAVAGGADAVQQARAEIADANRELAEVERVLAELRHKLDSAQHREERLLAITDMLIAREEAQRRVNGYTPVGMDSTGGTRRRSVPRRLLDRLRRH